MNNARRLLAVLILALLAASPLLAQNKKAKTSDAKAKTDTKAEAPLNALVTVTTLHRNLKKKDGSNKEWLALEREYFDKVTSKNNLILGSNVLTHYFTSDNTEILLVSAYANWDDIEKAAVRSDELVKAGWPDEKARDAFFAKRASYYADNHSDEIYQEIAGGKMMKTKPSGPMLYYVRKTHFAYPEDRSQQDFRALFDKYLQAVTYKNDYVKGYYPHVHAWGANNTEFTEVFVVDSLADVEKMFDRDDELFKAAWKTDAEQKQFDDSFNKYFDGTHSDYIYRCVAELIK